MSVTTPVTVPGIGFALTEEQRAIQDVARQFARDVLRPLSKESDERAEFPREVLKKAAELGLNAYGIPEAYGGPGLDPISSAIVVEELGWGCVGLASTLLGTMLASYPLIVAGTEEQKRRYLPMLASPEGRTGAVCITEPDTGSDVAAMTTKAVRHGTEWVINGTKAWITNNDLADVYIVFAKTDEGVTSFLVDGDNPGVKPAPHERKIGMRASHTGQVFFEDCRVSEHAILESPGRGLRQVVKFFLSSRPMVGAMGVGVARAAWEAATAYGRERVAFGQPIIANQGVSFMLADMAMQIEAARLLVWKACHVAMSGEDPLVAAAYAKCFATDMAMKVTTDAVQVFGGNGVSPEYMVEKWMRDAKVLQIVEGTNQIQRLIIGRYMADGRLG